MVTRSLAAASVLLLAACGTQSSTPATGSGATSSATSTSSATWTSFGGGVPGSSGASGGGTRPVGRLIELTGTYEASGADRSPTPFVPGSKVTLRVLDRTISVSAGCNTISGPAHVEDSRLVLDEGVGMTEMGCEKRLMDQDAWLADHLSKRPRLDRSGRQLSLVWDDARLDLIWAAEQILPGDPPGGPDEPISTSLTTEPGPS